MWLGFAADPSCSLLVLALCTRCFQGRGCRIQCKRQRHDLHVKLNSPQCQLSPGASWNQSRGLNPLQLIEAVPCSLPRAPGSATVPRSSTVTGSLAWGSPRDGFTGNEKGNCESTLCHPTTAAPVPPGCTDHPKGFLKHGAPSRGFMQPQFPHWGVERKLILCISPFSLGFRAR